MNYRHVPKKCKKCRCIDMPFTKHPRIRIFLLMGLPRREETPILDTGCPVEVCFFSEKKFKDIFRLYRLDNKQKEDTISEIVNMNLIFGVEELKISDISDVLPLNFCIHDDDVYLIERQVIGCSVKGMGFEDDDILIGLDCLRSIYIISGDQSNEESLEISLLPNRQYGYVCRGLIDAKCHKNKYKI